eukprot:7257527-Karenia_brevis.AAC.1
MLQSDGQPHSHSRSRLEAFQNAANMLLSTLSRIPGCSHGFLTYIWQSLVVPVLLYGQELFDIHEQEFQAALQIEARQWRKMLRIGGRSPLDAIKILRGTPDLLVDVRAQRLGFLLRLINAPVSSWQHAALITHMSMSSRWLTNTIEDLKTI